MATQTTHLHLKKPSSSDLIKVSDFNDNFDTIDAAVYANQAAIDDIENAQMAVKKINVSIAAGATTNVISDDFITADSTSSGIMHGTFCLSNNLPLTSYSGRITWQFATGSVTFTMTPAPTAAFAFDFVIGKI